MIYGSCRAEYVGQAENGRRDLPKKNSPLSGISSEMYVLTRMYARVIVYVWKGQLNL